MAMMNEMEYRTIGSALAGGYRAAVYCRLSKDDDLQGESASIANQRDMLEKYCEKQGWEVVAVYQDDGFTGLNMEGDSKEAPCTLCQSSHGYCHKVTHCSRKRASISYRPSTAGSHPKQIGSIAANQ